jgi:hypothetical protein
VARANEKIRILDVVDRAAKVRADSGKDIEFVAVPDEPNPADHIIGMKAPGIAANVADDDLRGYAVGKLTTASHRLVIAIGALAVTGVDKKSNGGDTENETEQGAQALRGPLEEGSSLHPEGL